MRALIITCLLALPVATLSWATLAPADAEAQTPQQIRVKVGSSVSVPLPRQPKFLSVENSAIASAVVLGSGQVKVTGKAVGTTRLVGRDFAEMPMVIPIVVVAK